MDSSPVRHVARQVGLWGLLILVVALSTLLFNILGTISTSVVAGMIMAACRRWQWRAIPVSLVFPLVGFVLALVSKGGLELRQCVAMVGVCFGAFWVVYFPALFLMRMEEDQTTPVGSDGSKLPTDQRKGEALAQAVDQRMIKPGSDVANSNTESAPPFSLHDLQGTWICETGEECCKRRMEITEDKFAVNVMNSTGSVRLLVQGDIRLEGMTTAKTLLILPAPRQGAGTAH